MSKVSAALAANDLSPGHAVARVFFRLDVSSVNWFVKAWPTGTGFKLCLRIEEFGAADDARAFHS